MRTLALVKLASSLVGLPLAAGCGGQSYSQGERDAGAGEGGSRAGTGGLPEAGAGGIGGLGNGGFAGMAYGGNGGDAGNPNVTCSDPDLSLTAAWQGAPTRSTTVGTNGSFTDECDAAGDLTEYTCATVCTAAAKGYGFDPGGRGGMTPCVLRPSGEVAPVTVACAGQCREGTCYGNCPNLEDTLTVVFVDEGIVVLELPEDDALFECVPLDPLDPLCTSAELVDDEVRVASVETCDPTLAVIGVVPVVATQPTCRYSCSQFGSSR